MLALNLLCNWGWPWTSDPSAFIWGHRCAPAHLVQAVLSCCANILPIKLHSKPLHSNFCAPMFELPLVIRDHLWPFHLRCHVGTQKVGFLKNFQILNFCIRDIQLILNILLWGSIISQMHSTRIFLYQSFTLLDEQTVFFMLSISIHGNRLTDTK